MKYRLVLAFVLFFSTVANARIVKGVIKDAQTGEEIIGASVVHWFVRTSGMKLMKWLSRPIVPKFIFR